MRVGRPWSLPVLTKQETWIVLLVEEVNTTQGCSTIQNLAGNAGLEPPLPQEVKVALKGFGFADLILVFQEIEGFLSNVSVGSEKPGAAQGVRAGVDPFLGAVLCKEIL